MGFRGRRWSTGGSLPAATCSASCGACRYVLLKGGCGVLGVCVLCGAQEAATGSRHSPSASASGRRHLRLMILPHSKNAAMRSESNRSAKVRNDVAERTSWRPDSLASRNTVSWLASMAACLRRGAQRRGERSASSHDYSRDRRGRTVCAMGALGRADTARERSGDPSRLATAVHASGGDPFAGLPLQRADPPRGAPRAARQRAVPLAGVTEASSLCPVGMNDTDAHRPSDVARACAPAGRVVSW